ncbi:MFS transporter [Acinetobacter sp. NIPH 1852]|uniref:MFS transporter n=1 Tax=Acinetobacter sp. NIPH 1852 TaxID=2923428 RepID=UPI001F4A989A|nr:MFS transporter [Acinetobacter sp. NIPH 1852]MCH7308549.1 MFS transporter [Acinetobacter sp. NIPH 1852]
MWGGIFYHSMDINNMNSKTKPNQLSPLGGFSLLTVAALTIMVGCVIVPGLPNVAAQLQITVSSGWLVTLPSLGVILFSPLAARLMDKVGLRSALMLGLFLYGLFGVIGVFLSGNLLVFIDRILLGGATAIIMAAGTGLISEFYQGEARMSMLAKQGMSIELGGVIFLFIGGLLASMNWSYPFALYLMAWVLLLFVKISIPNTKSKIIHESRITDYKKLPAGVVIAYIAATISMILFFTGIIVLPGKLSGLSFNEAETGYYLSFISLIAVIGAAALPMIARKLSEHIVLGLSMFSYAVAHFCFSFAASTTLIVFGGVMLGIGFGLSIPLVNHLTVEYSSERCRSRNLAYLSMAIFSGQFLSSFMEFIPGEISIIFITATLIAVVAGLVFSILRPLKEIKL